MEAVRKRNKQTLTTGEAAQYCSVNFRTVIRWIKKGYLKAHQLPGRGDNRIELSDFVDFLEKNGFEIPIEFSKRNRVLIVDDELPMANAIQRVLKRNQIDTAIALDGFQAGTLIPIFSPTIVTLDLNMPSMDGFEVIKFIKNNESLHKIKILIISALEKQTLKKAIQLGADDFLQKPFENDLLLEKITRLSGGQYALTTQKQK